ncbi:MAG: NADP transhydrogenase subunit alpha [Firmicutes bacterium]|jgi:opine dehydrogenase|nr:NADP transhydrogenase subunit alpha [Bacillota bacterium]
MSELVFAVLGGGHGGIGTAADLAVKGFPVRLYSSYQETIAPIAAQGGLELEVLPSSGLKGGFARLELATTDIGEAVRGANIIMVVTPAPSQRRYAEKLAPHLTRDQVVVLNPGSFGGALEFSQILAAHGAPPVAVAETECLVYAGRKKSPTHMWLRGYKKHLRVAAFPGRETARVLSLLRKAYPDWEEADSVLETSLSNPNPIIHIPIMVLNAARIEAPGDFLFYWEGVTPVVGYVITSLDNERLAVGKALGVPLRSVYEQDLEWYSHQGAYGANIHETHVNNPIYQWSMAPKSFDHRYLTEDTPYGLVPIEDLGRRLGVPTPSTSATIQFVSLLTRQDLRHGARTLTKLGLADLSPEELNRYVKSGSRKDEKKCWPSQIVASSPATE